VLYPIELTKIVLPGESRGRLELWCAKTAEPRQATASVSQHIFGWGIHEKEVEMVTGSPRGRFDKEGRECGKPHDVPKATRFKQKDIHASRARTGVAGRNPARWKEIEGSKAERKREDK